MILCVTGPMASGKNAAASILEKKGFVSVDADILVHKAIGMMTPKIIETFKCEADKTGIKLISQNGTLDRRALGALIFSRPALLKQQEAIVYPIISDMVEQFISRHAFENIAVNATVLYKIAPLLSKCDAVLFVDAPFLLRFIRAKKRDKMKSIQILQRFCSQKSLFAQYQKSCADIKRVWNISSLAALERKINIFLKKRRL